MESGSPPEAAAATEEKPEERREEWQEELLEEQHEERREDEEDLEHRAKRRRFKCMEFALVAKCDTTMAHTFLNENDWEVQKALQAYFELPENDPAWPKQPPLSFKSEALPDCFTPPKGHSTDEMIPSFTPTMPTSSCSATLQIWAGS